MYLDYLGTLNAVASILTRGIQGNPDRREQDLAKAEAETEATWPNDQDAQGGAGATKSGSGQEGPSSGASGRSSPANAWIPSNQRLRLGCPHNILYLNLLIPRPIAQKQRYCNIRRLN